MDTTFKELGTGSMKTNNYMMKTSQDTYSYLKHYIDLYVHAYYSRRYVTVMLVYYIYCLHLKAIRNYYYKLNLFCHNVDIHQCVYMNVHSNTSVEN